MEAEFGDPNYDYYQQQSWRYQDPDFFDDQEQYEFYETYEPFERDADFRLYDDSFEDFYAHEQARKEAERVAFQGIRSTRYFPSFLTRQYTGLA